MCSSDLAARFEPLQGQSPQQRGAPLQRPPFRGGGRAPGSWGSRRPTSESDESSVNLVDHLQPAHTLDERDQMRAHIALLEQERARDHAARVALEEQLAVLTASEPKNASARAD